MNSLFQFASVCSTDKGWSMVMETIKNGSIFFTFFCSSKPMMDSNENIMREKHDSPMLNESGKLFESFNVINRFLFFYLHIFWIEMSDSSYEQFWRSIFLYSNEATWIYLLFLSSYSEFTFIRFSSNICSCLLLSWHVHFIWI